ncbi:hypothetical protein BCR34DRAFT_604457 [Clohesyomyces aquaticus]|uniref:Uncharacterized protein n=1 Tax=Clohesyomyces aquaticus TaxID=1231657 RepID=A0A1Y1Z624_9PLEO|nr:hypothetical protein BCR34DRAFT_604457 [Clohesyomyces aquaticus]
MSSEKPTFLLLRERLEAEYGTQLLGRFVTHPERPFDNSGPQDPATIIHSTPTKIEEQSASHQLKSIKHPRAYARAEGLIDLSADKKKSSTTKIENTSIKTYRLTDHYKAFDMLIGNEEVKKDLFGPKGLFTRSKGELYWIVGIKTCSDGTHFSVQNEGDTALATKLTLPLSKALGAPGTPNPVIGASSGNEHSNARSFQTIGEQVFAVEYKTVRQQNVFGRFSATAEPKVEHNVVAQNWKNGVFEKGGDGVELNDAAFDDKLNEQQAANAAQATPAAHDETPQWVLEDENTADFDGLADVEVLLI